MKNVRESTLTPLFNEEELEICQILADFDNITTNPPIVYNFPNNIPRKKRSTRARPPSALPCQHLPTTTINSEAIQTTETINNVEVDNVEVDNNNEGQNRPSPASPLSISSSSGDDEPDQKPKNSSKKRGREDYMRTIKELTQTGEILKKEIKTVKNYYDQLRVSNQKLKAWKEKCLLEKDEEIKNMNGVDPLTIV